jgi:hypothetical protein
LRRARRAARLLDEAFRPLVFSFYGVGFLLLWMTVVTIPISQIYRLGVLAEWWRQNGSLLEVILDLPIALGFMRTS